MRLSTRIKLALVLWLAAEVFLFALAVDLIGFPLTVLIGLATTIAGFRLLRQAGASAMTKLRAALDGRRLDDGPRGRILDDTLATFGAVALVLPGFLSDVVGVALATAAVRHRLVSWIDRGGLGRPQSGFGTSRHGPATIDLAPDEWQRNESKVNMARPA